MIGLIHDPDTGEGFPLHGRADWGARPPRQVTPFTQVVTEKVRHHLDATTPTSLAGACSILRAAQNYHMDVKHWSDIAYNMAFSEYGIFQLRGINTVGGATLNHNFHTIACVYVGNGDDPVADKAFRALRCLEKWIDAQRPEAQLLEVLHSDLFPTACPGKYITAWHHAGSPIPGNTDPHPPQPPPSGHCHFKHQGATPRLLHLTYAGVPSMWMRGADVAEIQYLLDVINHFEKAHVVPVDGVWGPSTAGAVERFQAVWNFYRPDIKVDGVVGPKTRAAICEVLNLQGVWK